MPSRASLAVGLTGSASVIAREAIAVNVGAPAATPAAATATAEECPRAAAVAGSNAGRAEPGASARRDAGVEGDLATLDADAVRQAAAEVAALGQTQRGIAAPEAAVAANRLVVTALSTYARGLEVIANAAAEQDADLLAQGQSVLADGGQLLQRAEETVSALASACAHRLNRASAWDDLQVIRDRRSADPPSSQRTGRRG